MLSLLGAVCILLVIFYVSYYLHAYFLKRKVGNIKLYESELIKKFNKTIKKLTDRNLNTIKEELLEILDEYRHLKCEEYIETITLLKESLGTINDQVLKVKSQEKNIIDNIKKLKNNKNVNEKLGAKYIAELEKIRQIIDSLKFAQDKVNSNIKKINNEVSLFNSKYELKKSEIIIMIADSIATNNIGSIDIKLNDLVTEFNSKIQENKTRVDVTKEIYNIKSEESSLTEYDETTYIEKFKNFSE